MPENENGTPQIETLVDGGPVLADSEQLRFYQSKLYKMSKIPENRFDKVPLQRKQNCSKHIALHTANQQCS